MPDLEVDPSDPQRFLDALPDGRSGGGIRLGVERPRRLLAALGSPERRFPAVLVAGTFGKGSTAALLDSMLRAAGHRCGLYTSPHLETVEETVRLAGACIAPEVLAELLERVRAAARGALGGLPTAFEALTAAALLHFAEREVEIAVVEAGMGGARDATNVCRPVLSLLTGVALEHRPWLGDTPGAIAREKAGVLRAGRPALAAAMPEEAREAVGAEARRLGARLAWLEREARWRVMEAGSGEASRVLVETSRARHLLELPLAGVHQAANLALAVCAAEVLAQEGWERVGAAAIAEGARAVRWPGRLERVELPEGGAVLLDAAHDPASVAALLAHLETLEESWDLLFGVLEDKEAERMLPPLAARAGRVTLTRAPGHRGRDPGGLAALLAGEESGGERISIEPDPGEALARAAGGPGLLVACGSLALVGRLRGLLRRWIGRPEAICGGTEGGGKDAARR